jgi:hypothetical protein
VLSKKGDESTQKNPAGESPLSQYGSHTLVPVHLVSGSGVLLSLLRSQFLLLHMRSGHCPSGPLGVAAVAGPGFFPVSCLPPLRDVQPAPLRATEPPTARVPQLCPAAGPLHSRHLVTTICLRTFYRRCAVIALTRRRPRRAVGKRHYFSACNKRTRGVRVPAIRVIYARLAKAETGEFTARNNRTSVAY